MCQAVPLFGVGGVGKATIGLAKALARWRRNNQMESIKMKSGEKKQVEDAKCQGT
jgi:hypothetical protein